MKTEVETTETKEPKIQYILDEQGNLTEMLKDGKRFITNRIV